ncbi:MAG: NAD(P)H-dependent glycerol-3-phosphate dehydrogenase [Chloroflexota bacterium]
MGEHLAVMNAGGWGTALAVLLASSGHDVWLWCRRPEQAEAIRRTRENDAYLPGVRIPDDVNVTTDLNTAVERADAVLLAPISRAMRETATLLAPHLRAGMPVLHASKGLELGSLKRLSEVVAEELGRNADDIAVLSGPTHAEEVARGLPAAAVVGCGDTSVATLFQDVLHGSTFRVYTSTDVVGIELCAALKNVIALATGGCDGLGLGDNTRAALITRALSEIGRLVEAAGGHPRTVAGLAGLGDVVATCTSPHSRNRWAGEQLGRGQSVDDILASTRQVIEGIPAAQAAVRLARRYGVELPICAQVDAVVNGGAAVGDVLRRLMSRDATHELS